MLYDSFVKCLTHLLDISNLINDGWESKTYDGNVYLVKTVTQILKNTLNCCCSEVPTNPDIVEFDNQSVDVPDVTIRKWEYHVLYSHSYNAPVLYFNVWKSSGELLNLDELWESVNENYKKQVFKNKWFTLTQQEHPYLFQPFFYFHPCDTCEFLKIFETQENNMLITWLSSIGQIIWLEMDHMYGKLCNLNEFKTQK